MATRKIVSVDEAAVQAKRAIEAQMMQRPGVTGVGVGLKRVGGRLTDILAIRIYVQRKRDNIPADERIPAMIAGFPTDVIESEPSALMACTNEDIDPSPYFTVCGGISGGVPYDFWGKYFAGTLGVVMKNYATGKFYILTNSHVVNPANTSPTPLFDVIQPSAVDGGTDQMNHIGNVATAIFQPGAHGMDVGLVALRGTNVAYLIEDIGAVAGQSASVPLNTAVRKRGRTTRVTEGIVADIDYSTTVKYEKLGSFSFQNQIGIESDMPIGDCFCAGGDSGSVLVDAQNLVLGLMFAGDDATGSGTATPILTVIEGLSAAGYPVGVYWPEPPTTNDGVT